MKELGLEAPIEAWNCQASERTLIALFVGWAIADQPSSSHSGPSASDSSPRQSPQDASSQKSFLRRLPTFWVRGRLSLTALSHLLQNPTALLPHVQGKTYTMTICDQTCPFSTWASVSWSWQKQSLPLLCSQCCYCLNQAEKPHTGACLFSSKNSLFLLDHMILLTQMKIKYPANLHSWISPVTLCKQKDEVRSPSGNYNSGIRMRFSNSRKTRRIET